MEESTTREKVLKKVRHALIYKTDNPYPNIDFESQIYKPLSESSDVNFAEVFTSLGGVFIYCENEFELEEAIIGLHSENKWDNVFCADPEIQCYLTQATIPFESDVSEIDAFQVSVVSCELLVARLGSIMVSSRNGRKVNIASESLVVIASTHQLVDNLAEAFDFLLKKYQGRVPSMVSFITGPSRTADIEKTLVMGAHGPKNLFLILVESSNS